MIVSGRRIPLLVMGLAMAVALGSSLLSNNASAAQITSRSLTLQAGATDGGSMPGGVVNHLFGFTVPTTGNVGSIKFEYCTTASGTCTTPTGLVTTSATMGSQSGATGFTLDNTTNGAPYVTRTAASITAATAVTYQLLSVTNPTTTNQSFFVRIATYASIDTTGGVTDTGTVTASTATQIVLTGTMPESLIFCTGETVSTTGGIPDCSTATAGAVSFNQLFSPTDTATATSQMAASTNGTGGYSITVAGPTMTSGGNTIAAMGTATTGTRGTSQFGLNLKANTASTSTPSVGTEVAPAANGTDLKGQAITGYNTADTFKFTSGDSVADSANGGTGPTNAQIYTASYIVNVAGSQTAGTYTTTLTYVCTATF
jgi:filamentous hemagglutinin